MTCLFNNPAQFMTITLGVFLGRFAYDLPRWPSCGKPEALAGSLRAVPADDRPGAGPPHPARPTALVAGVGGADDSFAACLLVRDRSGTGSHPPTPGSSRDSSDVRSPIE